MKLNMTNVYKIVNSSGVVNSIDKFDLNEYRINITSIENDGRFIARGIIYKHDDDFKYYWGNLRYNSELIRDNMILSVSDMSNGYNGHFMVFVDAVAIHGYNIEFNVKAVIRPRFMQDVLFTEHLDSTTSIGNIGHNITAEIYCSRYGEDIKDTDIMINSYKYTVSKQNNNEKIKLTLKDNGEKLIELNDFSEMVKSLYDMQMLAQLIFSIRTKELMLVIDTVQLKVELKEYIPFYINESKLNLSESGRLNVNSLIKITNSTGTNNLTIDESYMDTLFKIHTYRYLKFNPEVMKMYVCNMINILEDIAKNNNDRRTNYRYSKRVNVNNSEFDLVCMYNVENTSEQKAKALIICKEIYKLQKLFKEKDGLNYGCLPIAITLFCELRNELQHDPSSINRRLSEKYYNEIYELTYYLIFMIIMIEQNRQIIADIEWLTRPLIKHYYITSKVNNEKIVTTLRKGLGCKIINVNGQLILNVKLEDRVSGAVVMKDIKVDNINIPQYYINKDVDITGEINKVGSEFRIVIYKIALDENNTWVNDEINLENI